MFCVAKSFFLTHKAFFPLRQHFSITASTTNRMAATATRPRNPKMTPMAMAPAVDRPDGGTNGGAEVVAATGQSVEFSWEGLNEDDSSLTTAWH